MPAVLPLAARAWFVLTVLVAVLCTALAYDRPPVGLSAWWLAPLAVPLIIRTSTVVIQNRKATEIALDSVVLIFVAFGDPSSAVLLWAIGCVLGQLSVGNRSALWTRFYNTGLSTLAGLAALTVIAHLPRAYEPGPWGLVAALLGATSYFLVDHFLSAVTVPLRGRGSLRESLWDEALGTLALTSVGVAALGFLGAVVLRHEPWALLFVLVSVCAFIYATRGFADAHESRQRVVALFQGAAGLHNAATQERVGEVVGAAGRACLQAEVSLSGTAAPQLKGWGAVEVPYTEPQQWLVARKRAGEVLTTEDELDLQTLAGLAGDSLQRLRLLATLERLARHDPLTGLPNRAALHERVRVHEQQRLAVLFVDLDGFKQINDRLGHEAGDLLLQTVARRLELAVRPGDCVARIGGDEFAVLLPGAGAETAMSIGERIIDAVRLPVDVGFGPMLVGASIGVAAPLAPAPGRELLHDADVAMYSAKAQKGRVVLCTTALREEQAWRSGLADQLRGAGERGELVVHYQPVLDLRTGATVGLEALVRWEHPVQGLLPPGAFIELAEQTMLADEIGREVLRQITEDAPRLAAAVGHRVLMGINLSPASIVRGDVLSDLRTEHEDFGLVVEVLETTLADPDAVPVLAELRTRGVRVAIDDFGSGHSLAALRQLPVDTVKLDRAFVSDIVRDRRAHDLVRFVEQLTSSLGVSLVAEGIEDGAQQEALLAMGVILGQGFYLGRPAPLTASLERLAARRLVPG